MARILLIDDDEWLRQMLRLTLIELGHEVVDAPNGMHALLLHSTYDIEVVLTDIIMPEKEGIATIIELRRKLGARIVAMSGGGRISAHDCLELARRLGAIAVLAKPFSTTEMTTAIERALREPVASA
jgi:DNA-binding NtrC family response regulator